MANLADAKEADLTREDREKGIDIDDLIKEENK